jgi:hypothetical protein
MNITLHRRLVLWVLGTAMAAALVLVAAASVSAEPITVTTVQKESGTFTDTFVCQDELYDITVNDIETNHVTAAGTDEDGNPIPPFTRHYSANGQVLAVPTDGTGPTYTGHYREREQFIAQQFDDFIGTFSYSAVVTAKGSDGSMLNFHVLERYSVNANGEVTVEFVKATC